MANDSLCRRDAGIGVLIVAEPEDAHAQIVAQELDNLDILHRRFCYGDLAETEFTWSPGTNLLLADEVGEFAVSNTTTIWWRRVGHPDTSELAPDEEALCLDEVHATIPGALTSVDPRWVDPPTAQWSAGRKLAQLAVAKRLGISIPPTLVTNSPQAATTWAHELGRPIVAKAVSSGLGIAPFVDTVPIDELSRVSVFPTMLQAVETADCDVRVVTVGDECFSWARGRPTSDPPDWRQLDPEGSGFSPRSWMQAEQNSQRIARELGLTFSVQDWLALGDKLTFLEVNPQGQWLFLDQAAALVAPALARHLGCTTHGAA